MKNLTFFLLLGVLLFSGMEVHAQSAKWEWVQNGPESISNRPRLEHFIRCSTVDGAGNSYVCGGFEDTVEIGTGKNSKMLYSTNGSNSIFVAKYDVNGNLLWVKTAEAGVFGDAYFITTDKTGHIYVSGIYGYGTGSKLDFGNGVSFIDSVGNFFIVCYDTSGKAKWANSSSGSNLEGLSSDSVGNCVIIGSNFYYLGYGVPHLSNVFVDLFDANGKFVFSDTFNSDGRVDSSYLFGGAAEGTSVSWDNSHNFYVTGSFTYNLIFNGVTHYANTTTNYQSVAFLAKYNTNRKIQWIKYFEEKEGDAWITSAASGRDDNIYIAGGFESYYNKSSFLDADSTQLPISDSLFTHLFLGSSDANGKIRWVHDISKNEYTGNIAIDSDSYIYNGEYIGNIAIDSNSGIYLVGFYSDTVTFGKDTLTSLGNSNSNLFVAKYDNRGNEIWAIDGSSSSDEEGFHINVSGINTMIILGGWGSNNVDTAWFGNIMVTKKQSGGMTFLAKLLPCTPPVISKLTSQGSLNYCIGDTIKVLLKISTKDTGDTITWMDGGSIISSGIDSVFHATTVGNYYALITNAKGCQAVSNSITIGYYPQVKTKPMKLSANCADTLYADTSNEKTYQWYFNNNQIPGANSKTYFATASGKYNVEMTSVYGCKDISSSIQLNLSGLISTATISHGKTSFCTGDKVKVLFVAASGYSYQWYKDSSIIAGSTAHTFTTTDTGKYQVLLTNDSGCQKISAPVDVILNPLPPTPIIKLSHDTLTSSAKTGNQWYRDSALIQGATNQQYVASSSGNYSVMVTDSNGCSAMSTNVNYTITGIGQGIANFQFQISPNPFTTTLSISYTLPQPQNVQLTITDITSKQIASLVNENQIEGQHMYIFDAEKYTIPVGIYFLRMVAGNAAVEQKIMRIK